MRPLRSARTSPGSGLFSLPRLYSAVDFSVALRRQPTGLTMLPGGTPASLRLSRNSAAIMSRSAPADPQTMRRCWSRALRAADCQGRSSIIGPSDGEDAPVLVNDDQEERSCRFVFVHRDRLAATTAFGATRGAAADAAATLLSTHLGRLVAERSVPKAVVGRQGSRTIQRPSEAHSSMPWKRA